MEIVWDIAQITSIYGLIYNVNYKNKFLIYNIINYLLIIRKKN
jgi:hypothetical protein